jgi:hypothetical protein
VADRDNHETTGPHSHEGGQNDEAPVHRYARQSTLVGRAADPHQWGCGEVGMWQSFRS